jgi:hypothetical protein
MKKYSFIALLTALMALQAHSQSAAPSGYVPKGKNQQVSFTASLPVGVFADSHIAGAGLAYGLTCHRFGDSVNAHKAVGFTLQAGLDYYFGKKVTTAGYGFRYGNYLYAHLMPGIIYNPTPNTNVLLLAGPALGIYKESSSLGLGVNLSAAYYFNTKMSVGPVVMYRKHAEVDALWAAGVKVAYTL